MGMRVSGMAFPGSVWERLMSILWHDRLGRAAALIAVLFCLALAPFGTSYLAVPIAIKIQNMISVR
jgi:hypothetical protein